MNNNFIMRYGEVRGIDNVYGNPYHGRFNKEFMEELNREVTRFVEEQTDDFGGESEGEDSDIKVYNSEEKSDVEKDYEVLMTEKNNKNNSSLNFNSNEDIDSEIGIQEETTPINTDEDNKKLEDKKQTNIETNKKDNNFDDDRIQEDKTNKENNIKDISEFFTDLITGLEKNNFENKDNILKQNVEKQNENLKKSDKDLIEKIRKINPKIPNDMEIVFNDDLGIVKKSNDLKVAAYYYTMKLFNYEKVTSRYNSLKDKLQKSFFLEGEDNIKITDNDYTIFFGKVIFNGIKYSIEKNINEIKQYSNTLYCNLFNNLLSIEQNEKICKEKYISEIEFTYNYDSIKNCFKNQKDINITENVIKNFINNLNGYLKNLKNKIITHFVIPFDIYCYYSNNIYEFLANLKLNNYLFRNRILHRDIRIKVNLFKLNYNYNIVETIETEELNYNDTRTQMVLNLNSYNKIYENHTNLFNNNKEIAFCKAVRLFLQGRSISDINGDEKTKISFDWNEIKFITDFTFLFFGCEVKRNPESLIIHNMVLDLIENGKLTFREVFNKFEIKSKKLEETSNIIKKASELKILPMAIKPAVDGIRMFRFGKDNQRNSISEYSYDLVDTSKRKNINSYHCIMALETNIIEEWLKLQKEFGEELLQNIEVKDISIENFIELLKKQEEKWFGVKFNSTTPEQQQK